jgi:hypothetical protein
MWRDAGQRRSCLVAIAVGLVAVSMSVIGMGAVPELPLEVAAASRVAPLVSPGRLLLTLNEISAQSTFGSDWTKTEQSVFTQTCPAVSLSDLSSLTTASADFDEGNGEGNVFEEVGESHTASIEYKNLEHALRRRCSVFSTNAHTGDLSFTVHGTAKPIAIGHYGNQSLGFLVKVPFSKHLTLSTGSILIRKGNYLLILGFTPYGHAFRTSQLTRYIPSALGNLPS